MRTARGVLECVRGLWEFPSGLGRCSGGRIWRPLWSVDPSQDSCSVNLESFVESFKPIVDSYVAPFIPSLFWRWYLVTCGCNGAEIPKSGHGDLRHACQYLNEVTRITLWLVFDCQVVLCEASIMKKWKCEYCACFIFKAAEKVQTRCVEHLSGRD